MKPTAEAPAPLQQEQQQQQHQKQYRRFSLNIFSKDRKGPKSAAPRPLSVPIAPTGLEPIPAGLEPGPTPAFIIDDSVLTESFGDLNFDCNSFMPGSPPTTNPITPTSNVDDISNSKTLPEASAKTADTAGQPVANINHLPTQTVPMTNPLSRRSSQCQSSESCVNSRRSSIRHLRSNSTPLLYKPHSESNGDFKTLETEHNRFLSKTGVKKANVLRLALLPFLRQKRGDFSKCPSPDDLVRRVLIFQKWWVGILDALRDRDKPVSGSDRAAFLEGIAGLICRSEWFVDGLQQTSRIFENLLFDTLRFIVAKLALKTVPITFSAFAGKILAYAFFYAPGVAPVLLHLLRVPAADVRRIIKVSFTDVKPSPQHVPLFAAINHVKANFPDHLSDLVGSNQTSKTENKHPPCPPEIPNMYGPWIRRWTSFNSDVFYSFLKHYYTIISQLLSADLPWNAHLASPGLITIHAFLLGTLDTVVHPRKTVQ
jgi:hypothetical protein